MYVVVGASGFIGKRVYDLCKRKGIDTVGTSTTGSQEGLIKFDLGSDEPNDLIRKIGLTEGDAVIITGAISNLHKCFVAQEESHKINVDGTIRLINALNERHIRFLFLSSDAVFDGVDGNYTEDIVPIPTVVYGKQKRAVEEYVLEKAPDGIVYRISKQYDICPGTKNLFSGIYEEAREKKQIRCIEGLIFNPTYVEDTAECILYGFDKNLHGLYQVASPETVLRYDLAKRLVKECGITDCEITNDYLERFELEEPRSFNASMDVSKFLSATGYTFTELGSSISKFGEAVRKA